MSFGTFVKNVTRYVDNFKMAVNYVEGDTALCALLTNVVSTVADVGGYLVHTLAIQHCQLLSESTGQLLIDGPGKKKKVVKCL